MKKTNPLKNLKIFVPTWNPAQEGQQEINQKIWITGTLLNDCKTQREGRKNEQSIGVSQQKFPLTERPKNELEETTGQKLLPSFWGIYWHVIMYIKLIKRTDSKWRQEKRHNKEAYIRHSQTRHFNYFFETLKRCPYIAFRWVYEGYCGVIRWEYIILKH